MPTPLRMILHEGWNVRIWSSVCTGVDRQKIAVEYSSLTNNLDEVFSILRYRPHFSTIHWAAASVRCKVSSVPCQELL